MGVGARVGLPFCIGNISLRMTNGVKGGGESLRIFWILRSVCLYKIDPLGHHGLSKPAAASRVPYPLTATVCSRTFFWTTDCKL